MSEKSIKTLLQSIGVVEQDLSNCSDIQEEFKQIKKLYFKKVLLSHPDKGGDPTVFLEVQTSFEILRSIFEGRKIASFITAFAQKQRFDTSGTSMPSFDYFQYAAEELVPIYKVELAKSGRSKCTQKSKVGRKCTDANVLIDKGEIRIGWINEQSGGYGGWVHLACWRVPSSLWLGLPDPKVCTDPKVFVSALISMNDIIFTGFSDLHQGEQNEIVAHVMQIEHWAKKSKLKNKFQKLLAEDSQTDVMDQIMAKDGNSAPIAKLHPGFMVDEKSVEVIDLTATHMGVTKRAKVEQRSNQLVHRGTDVVLNEGPVKFVIPVPGENGCIPGILGGKTIVMTGLFPEIGGGSGLSLGKERLKGILQGFGAKVTSAISGKTDMLMVGSQPGFSKVSKARASSKVQLVSTKDLLGVLQGGGIENVEPIRIENFSNGYALKGGNNSLALKASSYQMAIATGDIAAPKAIMKPKTPPKKQKVKKDKVLKKKKQDTESEAEESDGVQSEEDYVASRTARKRGAKVTAAKSKKQKNVVCDGCGEDCGDNVHYDKKSKSELCDDCFEEH
jgi:hypothetical protein